MGLRWSYKGPDENFMCNHSEPICAVEKEFPLYVFLFENIFLHNSALVNPNYIFKEDL